MSGSKNREAKNREEIWIRITAHKDEKRAKLFKCINEHPLGKNQVFIDTMAARLLVDALEKYDNIPYEELVNMALENATKLEGFARTLRQRYRLPLVGEVRENQNPPTINNDIDKDKTSAKVVDFEEKDKLNQKLERRSLLFGGKK